MNAVAWQALIRWLLLPAVGLPLSLVARHRGHAGFLERLGPWCLFVPVVLGAAYAGPGIFAALLVLGGLAAALEVGALGRRLNPAAGRGRAAPVLAPVVAWLLAVWMIPSVPPPVIAVGVLLGVPALARPGRRSGRSPAWRSVALGCSIGAALAAWLVLRLRPDGFPLVVFAFSVVVVGDILAFVGGRLFPRGRPFPSLSPQKTWTGYLFGLAGAVFAGYLAWFAVPEIGAWRLAGLAVLLGVAGAAGDLAASVVKRRHGVKDFSRALGAQGGILDRLDSLLGAGWIFVLVLMVLAA